MSIFWTIAPMLLTAVLGQTDKKESEVDPHCINSNGTITLLNTNGGYEQKRYCTETINYDKSTSVLVLKTVDLDLNNTEKNITAHVYINDQPLTKKKCMILYIEKNKVCAKKVKDSCGKQLPKEIQILTTEQANITIKIDTLYLAKNWPQNNKISFQYKEHTCTDNFETTTATSTPTVAVTTTTDKPIVTGTIQSSRTLVVINESSTTNSSVFSTTNSSTLQKNSDSGSYLPLYIVLAIIFLAAISRVIFLLVRRKQKREEHTNDAVSNNQQLVAKPEMQENEIYNMDLKQGVIKKDTENHQMTENVLYGKI